MLNLIIVVSNLCIKKIMKNINLKHFNFKNSYYVEVLGKFIVQYLN